MKNGAPYHLQYVLISGIVPIAEVKKVCSGTEKFYKMCESNEVGEINIAINSCYMGF